MNIPKRANANRKIIIKSVIDYDNDKHLFKCCNCTYSRFLRRNESSILLKSKSIYVTCIRCRRKHDVSI